VAGSPEEKFARHDKIVGDVPSRFVHQHDGVRAGGDDLGEFGEEQVDRAWVSSRVITSATPVSRAGTPRR
jgi:hypothetical protein